MRFEIEKGSITESMKLLMEEVAKRALESVILDGGLERGPNFEEINIGVVTCFNKSEDVDRKGLIFGRVTGIQGSDFMIKPANSDKEVKISKQRLIKLPQGSPYEMANKELETNKK